MTERLYYTNAYLTTFDARIVDRAEGGRRVYLDRTAFYPTSGGQPHDLGTIGGVAVEDVIDEENRIAHIVAEPVTADVAQCIVAWPRRFDFMQQHTGQHLLSAVFADGFGHQTVSVHFGSESSTLDLEGQVSHEHMLAVEQRSNAIVTENRVVQVSFADAATAEGLRKAATRGGTLRIVSIDGIDRSACGGTHVRTTGEIGAVLLRGQERMRKTTRVEFVCGLRAVHLARRDFEGLTHMAEAINASVDDVPVLVAAQSVQLKDTQTRARRLEDELNVYRARERYAATTPHGDGIRRLIERHKHGSPDEWRSFALAYCELPKSFVVVASEQPTAVLLATSVDSGIDAGTTLKAALQAVGGRGGGSPRIAQGSVPSAAALDQILRALEAA
jgi:alanyl-tRNA synthetase